MRRKNRSKYREIVLSILIVGALLAVSVSLFKPSITGFIVLQESNSIEMEFTSDESIALPIKDITALYINSYISNNFSGEVFLNDENRRYKILDYSIPELNEEVENSSIEFELNYNKISPEVADLSVAAEQYSCVEWKINDESICYGENSCCSLLNLESSGEKNEALYLNKGKYNAQDRNIVKAQLVYANYSLDIENAYSDIRYSDIKGIVVDLFDKLPLIKKSPRGEYEINPAFKLLALKKLVRAHRIDGPYFDFGNPDDISVVESFLKSGAAVI